MYHKIKDFCSKFNNLDSFISILIRFFSWISKFIKKFNYFFKSLGFRVDFCTNKKNAQSSSVNSSRKYNKKLWFLPFFHFTHILQFLMAYLKKKSVEEGVQGTNKEKKCSKTLYIQTISNSFFPLTWFLAFSLNFNIFLFIILLYLPYCLRADCI